MGSRILGILEKIRRFLNQQHRKANYQYCWFYWFIDLGISNRAVLVYETRNFLSPKMDLLRQKIEIRWSDDDPSDFQHPKWFSGCGKFACWCYWFRNLWDDGLKESGWWKIPRIPYFSLTLTQALYIPTGGPAGLIRFLVERFLRREIFPGSMRLLIHWFCLYQPLCGPAGGRGR